MRPPRLFIRMTIGCLWLVCVTLLALHGLTDHAHADLLASLPVAEHVPGDDHHHAAGGSCEMARTPSADVDGAASPLAPPFVGLVVAPAPLASGILDAREPLLRPPLFLLHAALLI